MLDGVYYNPTTIHFGKDMELKVGEIVRKHSNKILLHYGESSFKKYGLHDNVTESLKRENISYVELGGVKPNPQTDLIYEGIELCRQENINFILAVGGGSVIDSAKAISLGVPWSGDFFEFFEGKAIPETALKVGTILTVPGAGSESSTSSVVTQKERQLKISCDSQLLAPVFSILNPDLTRTLSPYQTSCGIIDAISHVFERYFSNTTYVDCSDRICEGLVKTLMKYALLVKDEPDNYDIRAEIMWASKLAQDNTAGFGRKQDWAAHIIGHEITAIYDIAHGATLSVIFPAWMKYVYQANIERFAQFAERIFNVDINETDAEHIIMTAIEKFTHFLKAIGMPTSLHEIGIFDKSSFEEIAEKSVRSMPSGTIGNFKRLSPQDIINILNNAC